MMNNMNTAEENRRLLEAMERENEMTREGLTIAVKEAVWAFLQKSGEPVDIAASRKAEGHRKADATGVNTATRMAKIVGLRANAVKTYTVEDLWTVGLRYITVTLTGDRRVSMPVLSSPAVAEAVAGCSKVRRIIHGLNAVARVASLEAERLAMLRRGLSVTTEAVDIETHTVVEMVDGEAVEGEVTFRPASPAALEAFGLKSGSLVRYINAESLVFTHADAKQGSHQLATLARLNLNADTVVDWFKTEPQATAYYCATCYGDAVNGYTPRGTKAAVNWGAEQVERAVMDGDTAARLPDYAHMVTPNACPTCATPRYLLSFNSNTAHLPLLTVTDEAGVARTENKAVKAVAFRFKKADFKRAKGVLTDRRTPTEAIADLMACPVEYRTHTSGRGFAWRMARLVPVWWADAQDGGDFTDCMGLAIQPLTIGQDGDTVATLD